MATMKRLAPLGLLLFLPALGACDDYQEAPDVVKSIHSDNPARQPYVLCRAGDTYREVTLTDAAIKQVKVGDTCPKFEAPPIQTTAPGPRR